MKSKEKFVKIANIVTKVLVGVLVALLVFCIGLVCFRACSAPHDIAYAGEADGVGTWVWDDNYATFGTLCYISSYGEIMSPNYLFDFVCDGVSYVGLSNSNLGPMQQGVVAVVSDSWVDQKYRTIDIKSAPPSDFLTILQQHATYQLPVSAPSADITDVWGGLISYVTSIFTDVGSLFYVNGNLTFVGVLAVVMAGVAVVLLVWNLIRSFFVMRG